MKKFLPILAVLLFVFAVPVSANTADDFKACLDSGKSREQCVIEVEGGPAQWYLPSPTSFGKEVYGNPTSTDVSKGRWVNSTAFEIALAAACGMVPCANTPAAQQQSAAGFFANSIDFMIKTRPASSVDYIAYMGNKLHVPGTPTVAYAAAGGQGFSSLSPILPIWTATRNLAYLVFAIIFVIVGLMIMFRVKIDPKTSANIQSALPKIIFALIIVTFSYAIAGFLIDVMYVLLALIVTLAGAISGVNGAKIGNDILSTSIFNTIWNPNSFFGTTGATFEAVRTIVANLLGSEVPNPKITDLTGQNIAGIGIAAIAFVIIAIALVVAIFRTWLALLGAYANIILGIIFAPLWLMMDAIPGQNQFSAWLRMMLSNLISFPAVFIMILIGEMIVQMGSNGASGFVPPLIGGSNFSAMTSLIGLGIILTIPATVKILQEMLKSPAFKYGTEWMSSTTRGGQGALIAGRFADQKVSQYIKPYAGAKQYVKKLITG